LQDTSLSIPLRYLNLLYQL